MPRETRSDEVLMDEVRAGSPTAFEALYDRHHRSVFTFLLRSLGERQKVEDLLQETFLRVFAHRERWRPTAAFRTWLFTIARNLVIDQLRRRIGGRDRTPTEPWRRSPIRVPLRSSGPRQGSWRSGFRPRCCGFLRRSGRCCS